MIDSVALTWGGSLGTMTRLARGQAEPVSDPVYLDLERLHAKYARFGELTTKRYDRAGVHEGGNYNFGQVQLLYQPGRLEARASLPKIITGDLNDVVLDVRGVHDALGMLVERVNDLVTDCGVVDPKTRVRRPVEPVTLREARPTRMDYVVQWEVGSVGWSLELLQSGFHPHRANMSFEKSIQGGRTLYFGKGGKRVLRFYDKGAEVMYRRSKEIGHHVDRDQLEAMNELDRRRALLNAKRLAREEARRDAKLDVTLRFEVQDRRTDHVRSIHELGWRACDVRHQLEKALSGIAIEAELDFPALLGEISGPHRVAYAAAPFYIAEHPEETLPAIRALVSDRAYYTWRRRAQKVTKRGWLPEIPPDSFDGDSQLWAVRPLAA